LAGELVFRLFGNEKDVAILHALEGGLSESMIGFAYRSFVLID
jgi:hypothetical protein